MRYLLLRKLEALSTLKSCRKSNGREKINYHSKGLQTSAGFHSSLASEDATEFMLTQANSNLSQTKVKRNINKQLKEEKEQFTLRSKDNLIYWDSLIDQYVSSS
jgi:hypothetical protein